MPRTIHIILQGVLALLIVAGIARYFYFTKPAPGEPLAVPITERISAEDTQTLLNANGCLGCHAMDKKLVGPAFNAVAARYKGDDLAVGRVSNSIRLGGAERWGDVAMPAMLNLSEEQAKQLALFVLQQ